jgi:DNA-binding beta-propeller fold protein YncE
MKELWLPAFMNSARFVVGSFLLPLVFCAPQFGQTGGTAATIPEKTIKFVSQFRSDSDVDIVRTPCQHVRDFFDHTGEAHGGTGERAAVCDQVLDVIAGKAEPVQTGDRLPIRAAKVVTDSQGRIIVTEPATRSVHILDFASRKYLRIDGSKDDRMLLPSGIAVDADDNVYVTDSKRGMIEVFNPAGKFKKYIGNFKGEGAFQLPTSIAIDRASGRIFLTDTPRHLVLILDRDGKELAHVGKRGGGTGPAEFLLPTELALHGQELFVLDSQNRRIQVFDMDGHFKREFKPRILGNDSTTGMAIDARGSIYLMQEIGLIEVVDAKGERIQRFGQHGAEPGEFIDSQGISIDSAGRLCVADTGNLRVQIFQILNQAKTNSTAASR